MACWLGCTGVDMAGLCGRADVVEGVATNYRIRGRHMDQLEATTWQPQFDQKSLINHERFEGVDRTPNLLEPNQTFYR